MNVATPPIQARLVIGAAAAAASPLGTSILACAPLSADSRSSTPSATALLILSREQDSFFPGVAFRAEIEIVPEDLGAISAIFVVTGGGVAASLEFDDVEQDEWFHVWSYASLDQLKAALGGIWTIVVTGDIASTSTFTLEAGALLDSDFFATPMITSPLDGAVGVPAGVVTSWLPPTSGPFPAYVLDVWIDYGPPDGPGSSPGPSNFLDAAATSWDPEGTLTPGLARLTVEYANAAPSELVGALNVIDGAIVWNPSRLAPPGYPAGAPLVGLSGRTRIGFTVSSCPADADLDCDGEVTGSDLGLLLANWGNPGTGDLDGSGSVDGADLGLLLGSWSA